MDVAPSDGADLNGGDGASPSRSEPPGLLAGVEAACQRAAEQVGIDGAGCLLLDADGALQAVCTTDAATRSLTTAEASLGEGPGHETLARGGELLGPTSLRPWPRLAALLADSSIETVVAAPVVRGSAPVGAVVAVAEQASPWSDEAVDATRALADHVCGLLDEALSGAHRERRHADPEVDPDHAGGDRDTEVIEQLLTALDNRHELDRAGSLIARQTGTSMLRARWRLRQLAEGMDVPALSIARRIIAHGRLPHPHEFLADASERSHREELARLALTDPLTGLVNRVLLLDRLEHAVWRSQRGRDRPAVLYIDLDGFKLVNDTLGHDIGDHVLRTAAARIQASVRPQDTVGRMGGDEFAVICEAVEGTPSAVSIARRIARAVEEPITLDELRGSRSRSLPATPTVGASIGIAVAAPGQSAEDVLRSADAAMYRSKLGPGHITVQDHAASQPGRSGSG
jgi:diguanylate cyclase (GGDEF)-like protein